MAHCARLFTLPYHGPLGEDRWARGIDRWGGQTWVLCDGASESYDPAGWAQKLAATLADLYQLFSVVPHLRRGSPSRRSGRYPVSVVSALDTPLDRAVRKAQGDYARRVQNQRGSSSDWLTRASQIRGSWSTALGIRIPANGAVADAWAVGDTELFILDGYEEKLRFPLKSGEEFTSSPPLIGSHRDSPTPRWMRILIPLRSFRHPKIILVSDALAAFIIESTAKGFSDLWPFLLRTPLPELSRWIQEQRNRGGLSMDDYTLMEIRP